MIRVPLPSTTYLRISSASHGHAKSQSSGGVRGQRATSLFEEVKNRDKTRNIHSEIFSTFRLNSSKLLPKILLCGSKLPYMKQNFLLLSLRGLLGMAPLAPDDKGSPPPVVNYIGTPLITSNRKVLYLG